MGVLNDNMVGGASGVTGPYTIANSCRFNDDDSPYLTWTPGSSGTQTKFTISFWYKIASTGSSVTRRTFFSAGTSVHNEFVIGQGSGGTGDDINIQGYISGSANFELTTNRKFRDSTNWYHVVVAVDTSQGTTSNKLKLYINGVEETSFATDGRSSMGSNQIVNSNVPHRVGQFARVGGHYMDGYIAEFHSVENQQLTPASFGETDEDYGHWKPIKYDGSYGTYGFYLDFKDSSSLGNDSAGSNNFSASNLSASDQVTDSPTNNFCILNPLDPISGSTFSEGNLKVLTNSEPQITSTFGVSSGKYYWEILQQAKSSGADGLVGIASEFTTASSQALGSKANCYGFYANSGYGNLVTGGSYTSYGTLVGWTTGDIVSVALDLDNNKCYWAVNGTYLNSGNPAGNSNGFSITDPASTVIGAYIPAVGDYGAQTDTFVANFGQDGTFAGNKTAQGNTDGKYGNFYYSVPSGFKALCLQNLPEPTVIPSEHFNIHTYTQSGSNNNGDAVTVTTQASNGIVWIKNRSFANAPALFDNVRGGTKLLSPSNYAVEETVGGGITFGTTSYTIGNDSGGYGFNNKVGNNYVAWSWRANGAGSSNSDGTITGTVSANPSAGFSVVSWTGTGSAGTVGHGLSQAPNLIIINNTQYNGSEWLVGSIQSLGSMDFTDILDLASNGAKANGTQFNDTAPTSSVFSVNGISSNNTSQKIIAYCFHSVEGYSKIGQYVGYSDLPFVYTGFRPQYLIQKRIDSSSGANWVLHDTKRDTNGNPIQGTLNIDNNNTEGTYTGTNWDVLSNGFKIRGTDAAQNASSSPYLYIAFADNPFKFSNAR